MGKLILEVETTKGVLLFAVFFLLGIKTRKQSSLHLPKKNCITSTNQMGKEAVKKVNN